MNIKDQNKQLTELKTEFRDTLKTLDWIARDAEEIVGGELLTENDKIVIRDYLYGDISLKTLRLELKK